MSSTNATRIVLASRPEGSAIVDNFRIEHASMPVPREGEVLLRTRLLSLDPYMRARMNAEKSYARATEIGEVMPGEAVAEVIESRVSTREQTVGVNTFDVELALRAGAFFAE